MGLNQLEALWTEKQAAQFLGMSVKFLQQDRGNAKRIPFMKLGRAVRYAPADVRAFVEARKVHGAQ